MDAARGSSGSAQSTRIVPAARRTGDDERQHLLLAEARTRVRPGQPPDRRQRVSSSVVEARMPAAGNVLQACYHDAGVRYRIMQAKGLIHSRAPARPATTPSGTSVADRPAPRPGEHGGSGRRGRPPRGEAQAGEQRSAKKLSAVSPAGREAGRAQPRCRPRPGGPSQPRPWAGRAGPCLAQVVPATSSAPRSSPSSSAISGGAALTGTRSAARWSRAGPEVERHVDNRLGRPRGGLASGARPAGPACARAGEDSWSTGTAGLASP
jgi:hypothetical protein